VIIPISETGNRSQLLTSCTWSCM